MKETDFTNTSQAKPVSNERFTARSHRKKMFYVFQRKHHEHGRRRKENFCHARKTSRFALQKMSAEVRILSVLDIIAIDCRLHDKLYSFKRASQCYACCLLFFSQDCILQNYAVRSKKVIQRNYCVSYRQHDSRRSSRFVVEVQLAKVFY